MTNADARMVAPLFMWQAGAIAPGKRKGLDRSASTLVQKDERPIANVLL